MQVWANSSDLLRDKDEVVDFQTAHQQIEKSFIESTKATLSDMGSDALIKALIEKSLSSEDVQRLERIV